MYLPCSPSKSTRRYLVNVFSIARPHTNTIMIEKDLILSKESKTYWQYSVMAIQLKTSLNQMMNEAKWILVLYFFSWPLHNESYLYIISRFELLIFKQPRYFCCRKIRVRRRVVNKIWNIWFLFLISWKITKSAVSRTSWL